GGVEGGAGGTGGGGDVGGSAEGGAGGAVAECVDSCANYIDVWDTTLDETTFGCAASFDAYAALQECACTNTEIGSGCGAICDGDINGTGTPNFCNGVPSLAQCNQCLMDVCGVQYDDCSNN
ncbi:MAG: hypothetical protein HOW73_51150, partial [Polyangiaceae bacterium]|nr:hypothetical protein [Polyangiaceae bacterium]